jgi:Cu-Zn family superoxide dismutase
MTKFNFKIILISVFILIFSILYYNYIFNNQKPIKAIAVFSNDGINGFVKFSEDEKNNNIRIDLEITGLKPNSKHGFHVHEAGDLTDKCTSMCAHFNPYGKTHGCPGMVERHVGDLGNILTNSKGEAKYSFYDNIIKLRGTTCNIIGRGVIIHEDADDCGKGGNEESLKTGNAGKRIACGVIGYSKENFYKCVK